MEIRTELFQKLESIANNKIHKFSDIAKFFLEKPNEIFDLSIDEVSKKCFVGNATLHRFSKALKLAGFKELKYKFKKEFEDATETIEFKKNIMQYLKNEIELLNKDNRTIGDDLAIAIYNNLILKIDLDYFDKKKD